MKKIKIFVVVLLPLLMAISHLNAYSQGKYGAQFLKIGVGAKATAMGDVFVGIADDPSTIYWNPAGMTQMRSVELLGMHNFWLLDMSYQYVAAVIPSHIGAFGVAVSYSSSGKIPKYENFQQIGEYTAYDAAGTLAYANSIGKIISFGIGVKFIQQRIEEVDARGFAVDLGVLSKEILGVVRIGFAVQNLGDGIKFIEQDDPLPLTTKGGISFKLGPITLAGDLYKLKDDDPEMNGGAELMLGNVLAIRGGYNTAKTYSAGLGLTMGKISIEYAFVPYEEIDNSQRIAVKVKF